MPYNKRFEGVVPTAGFAARFRARQAERQMKITALSISSFNAGLMSGQRVTTPEL
jgi:hypothetical protein